MVVADSQPGHIDQIKQTNAGAVYRLIDQLGPVSRIDLSRFAQLAPASITKIVREMLEAHLVQETEIQEPGSRGRPAVGLMVETEAWHYLAVRISRGEIHLSLRDLPHISSPFSPQLCSLFQESSASRKRFASAPCSWCLDHTSHISDTASCSSIGSQRISLSWTR